MVKVKVVYMNGKETEYDVDYPKAYIAKIMEKENELMLDRKSVKEIYASDKLIAKFNNGFLNELVLEKPKPKKTAGCDVGQYAVDDIKAWQEVGDKLAEEVEEEWDEDHALDMVMNDMVKDIEEENIWVMDHTGGNIEITYS